MPVTVTVTLWVAFAEYEPETFFEFWPCTTSVLDCAPVVVGEKVKTRVTELFVPLVLVSDALLVELILNGDDDVVIGPPVKYIVVVPEVVSERPIVSVAVDVVAVGVTSV